MATTRLGGHGGPRGEYGSFTPKTASGGKSTDQLTRLGPHGGARQLYGNFTKTPSGGKSTDQITRLGPHGGPRQLYGPFTKEEAITLDAQTGGGSKRSRRPAPGITSNRSIAMWEDEEMAVVLQAMLSLRKH